MNEEVKKIARAMITASHYNNLPEASFESYIREICQKFPKSPENPDGYEPRVKLWEGSRHSGKREAARIADKILQFEPKPDELVPEGAIPEVQKDKDGNEWLVGYWSSKPKSDEEMMAKIAKSNAIGMGLIPPDKGRLLTPQERSLAIIDYMREHGGVTESDKLTEVETFGITRKAQDAKTASIKDAECQERMERIFREIEESIWFKQPSFPAESFAKWWQALKKKELK